MFMNRYSTPSPPSSSTPALAVAATHKHKFSPGAIAGIVLVIIAFLVCALLALLWRIRRRRLRRHQFSDDRRGRTISPFTLLVQDGSFDNRSGNVTGADAHSDAPRGSIGASTIARQQLETQLRAATEKMVELEELAEGDPNAGGGGGAGAEGRAEHDTVSPARPTNSEAELRAQINMLVARVNAMDSVLGMGTGMGMGGEPPPEYA
ncbi:hypothetical protein C8R45DRAFT_1094599 [Mycena sanguinolenta]|nr:hypothetical protein C8R45DRAFT_1094599 [Mycena sanguinolenta]